MSPIKQDGTRPSKTLSKDDTLIMLRSAVGALMESGLVVGAKNHERGLVLTIEGAQVVYEGNRANFVQQNRPAYVVDTVYPMDVPTDVPTLPNVPTKVPTSRHVPTNVPTRKKKVPTLPKDYETRIFLPE